MDKISKAIHAKADESNAFSVVTPVYQASAFESDSDYFYTRKNNPNIEEFEQVVAILEEADHAIATTTGMSAIHLVLSLLPIRSTLVVNTDIYGCSYKLFQKYSEKMQIDLHILDLSVPGNISLIPPETNMVFFETPTNPFLKTINIQQVADHLQLKGSDALIVVDNTWATPLFQRPLAHGAHISLHSATKYFSGHSDVMGGCILVNDEKVHDQLKELRFYQGSILAPYSAWLLRRSLQTLELRLKQHSVTTKKIRDYLATVPAISTVYYPEVDGAQLSDYATLIFFNFRDEYVSSYSEFSKSLELFSTGTGMACVSSMIAQPYTGSHASMEDSEKAEMGLDRSLVRLSFGLEPAEDLINDLEKAFEKLNMPKD